MFAVKAKIYGVLYKQPSSIAFAETFSYWSTPLRRKFMECSINSPALSLLLKHLVIGQRLQTHNFSAFHWSPRGSLVSIGQHFVATRVVHLPKSTESDQSGPDHQLLQLCTAITAWSDSDQAVRAVHSCNSWFNIILSASLK